MDEAQHLADRLVILRAGDVVGSGTTAELSAGDGDTAVVTFRLDRRRGAAAVAADAERHARASTTAPCGWSAPAPQRDLYAAAPLGRRRRRRAARASRSTGPTLDDIFLRLPRPTTAGRGRGRRRGRRRAGHERHRAARQPGRATACAGSSATRGRWCSPSSCRSCCCCCSTPSSAAARHVPGLGRVGLELLHARHRRLLDHAVGLQRPARRRWSPPASAASSSASEARPCRRGSTWPPSSCSRS